MNQKEVYKETLANTIIKNLETRNMEGYYVKTAEEAREKVLSLMEDLLFYLTNNSPMPVFYLPFLVLS